MRNRAESDLNVGAHRLEILPVADSSYSLGPGLLVASPHLENRRTHGLSGHWNSPLASRHSLDMVPPLTLVPPRKGGFT